MDKNKLTQGWVEFLGREKWDLFVTITFRHKKTLMPAIKAFKRFFKRLNTTSERFFDKFILCLVFFEKNWDGKTVHIHSVIKGICPSKARSLEHKCNEYFGQSRVVPYDPAKGVKHYLANKEVGNYLKHSDFYKINSAKRQKSACQGFML